MRPGPYGAGISSRRASTLSVMSLSAVVSKAAGAEPDFDEDFEELDFDELDLDELDLDDEDFEELELDLDDEDFEELDFDFEELELSFSGCGWNGNISSNVYSGTYSAVLVDEVPSSSADAASAGGVNSFPSASMENAFASSASI